MVEHLDHAHGNDLPGEAVFVFQPPALLSLGIAALAEFLPIIIHLILCLALDLQGHSFVEFKMRPAIKRGEGLTIQLKSHGQDGTRRLAMDFLPAIRVMGNGGDLRVFENAEVITGSVLGLMVEPEAGGDF